MVKTSSKGKGQELIRVSLGEVINVVPSLLAEKPLFQANGRVNAYWFYASLTYFSIFWIQTCLFADAC